MKKYAALLLSRQPLRPTGDTAWVERTVAAVRSLDERRMGVVSSVGMQTWELITAVASDLGLPIKLILPISAGTDFDVQCESILHEYGLDPCRTEFLPASDLTIENRNDLMASRDQAVLKAADLLLPISVNDNGSMAKRLRKANIDGCDVDSRFQIPYQKRGEPFKVDLDPDQLSDEILNLGDDYLIHWTRSVSHPWPGERMIDYYRAITRSDSWPRSGLATLERIVDTQTVKASGRHMPGGARTVSFSALRPYEVIPLMRWRARYGEMSFEPYGIGISRDVAEKFGVLPVDYYSDKNQKQTSPKSAWLSQSSGKETDWRSEREYRCLGDLSLERVPPEAIVLFCRTSAEAERLRGRYFVRVVSFLR
jgi:hypothetical protein